MHCAYPCELGFEFHQVIETIDERAKFFFPSDKLERSLFWCVICCHGTNDSASNVCTESSSRTSRIEHVDHCINNSSTQTNEHDDTLKSETIFMLFHRMVDSTQQQV